MLTIWPVIIKGGGTTKMTDMTFNQNAAYFSEARHDAVGGSSTVPASNQNGETCYYNFSGPKPNGEDAPFFVEVGYFKDGILIQTKEQRQYSALARKKGIRAHTVTFDPF